MATQEFIPKTLKVTKEANNAISGYAYSIGSNFSKYVTELIEKEAKRLRPDLMDGKKKQTVK
jgi:hypothetical protein